ncbi:MAG: DUF2442 domain-containing protein [bacterium]
MISRVDLLPGAKRVSPQPSFRLEVELRSGETVFLDLEMLIRQRDAYWRLRQSRYFAMVRVDPLGGICWPEGEDLAPDGLGRYVVSQS